MSGEGSRIEPAYSRCRALVRAFEPRLCLSLIAAALSIAVAAPEIAADTVLLRSGVRFSDVKTFPEGEAHRVQFQDGSTQVIPNSLIRSVRPGRTSWKTPFTQPTQIQPVPPPTLPPPATPPVREPAPVPAASGLSPLMKSALLPGWGQYATGREATGLLYGAATALLVQQYWSYRVKHAAAERDYNDPIPVGAVALQSVNGTLSIPQVAAINIVYLAGKERKVYDLQRKGNNALALIPILYCWNLLDIVYGGLPWKSKWFRSSPSAGAPRFRLAVGRDSIAGAFSFAL